MQKEKLRQARIERGYTQKQLADILPTDISNYCRKENGLVGISRTEWKKFAAFLNVPEEEIYEENESALNNTFYDNSGITNQNVGISAVVLEHLYDYIALLKAENKRLQNELEREYKKNQYSQ
jgi:transcriptional regulator with XRE-family HTH domain